MHVEIFVIERERETTLFASFGKTSATFKEEIDCWGSGKPVRSRAMETGRGVEVRDVARAAKERRNVAIR